MSRTHSTAMPPHSPLLRAAVVAALGLVASAATATRLLRVQLDPGNYVGAATTIDPSGAPTFLFGSGNVVPASASAYDATGQLRWSYYNASAGQDTKVFQTSAARHCESGGVGAGAVDVFVTQSDVFNGDGTFSVVGLSSAAATAQPVWTLAFPDCDSEDGGFTVKAADSGARIVVQCTGLAGGRARVYAIDGQAGTVEWVYITGNPLSGTDTSAQITADGAWVLFTVAYAPDSFGQNATVLDGATGKVRDSSIPLPYYSTSSAISDSGNYVAVVDELAVNVYKWSPSRSAYRLAYVLPPPAGAAVDGITGVTMSTGRDKDEVIVALYEGYKPTKRVVVGIWSLVDAQLQTTWEGNGSSTFGGLSADGAYVAAALEDGAVLLQRGSNEEVFRLTSDVMFAVSINVRPSPGGGDTVFLAAAGGNNGGSGGGNTGDAYAYQVDVPSSSRLGAQAAPQAAPCFGTFNGDTPLEEVCFTTLLNSSTVEGLSVREYSAAAAAAAALVSYNVSALYPDAGFDEALTLGGFGVIEYFLGGFNKQKKSLLTARTVPFTLLPPAAAGGWVARMALSPSKYPAGAKAPAPLDNVTLVAFNVQPLILAALRYNSTTAGPTAKQLEALCARAASEIAAGALPGYSVDSASPFASGAYALYYGRDAPQSGPYIAECWLGVSKSS